MLARVDGTGEVAPVHDWLGIRFVEASHGTIVVEMDVKPHLMNTWGAVQGGILSSLADVACAGAALTTCGEGEVVTSLDLMMRFLRPARPDGKVIRASGRVLQRSTRNAHAQAELFGDEELVATASETLAIRSPG